ncbi:hypothetical protein HPB49_012592 [Dermacentor silvarum]|uniref:Uncharacterized protein n=1 Tax=Dermacentor silvarum TaxID=543639 RepID=A0ACB8DZG9_DERSI|nr:hypothetical protein HPB49_012592 [Dermacentor silvarum]
MLLQELSCPTHKVMLARRLSRGRLAWPFASDSIAYQTPPSRCPHRDDRTSTQTVPKEVASTEEEPTDSRRLPSDQPETLSRRTFADAVSLHGQTSLLRRKASFESIRWLHVLRSDIGGRLQETHTFPRRSVRHQQRARGTRRRAGNAGRTAGAGGFRKRTSGTANATHIALDTHRRPPAYAFTLIALHPPFETPALKETHTGIKKNEPHVPSRVSSPARNLIRRMLQQEPEKMPNIEAIMPYEFKTYGEFLCITLDSNVQVLLPFSLLYAPEAPEALGACNERLFGEWTVPSSSPGENQQTRSASSWPPFRPTSNCSRDALPPLGNFEAFLREHLSFYDATRNY